MGSAGASNPIRVGFIELPDEALDLLSEYTQRNDAEVSLVVGQDSESYALRMAEILQVPTLDRINRIALLNCDRLVVGPRPPGLLKEVEDVTEGTRIRVVSVEEALERSRQGDADFLLQDPFHLEPNAPEVQDAVKEILDSFDPQNPLGKPGAGPKSEDPGDFVSDHGAGESENPSNTGERVPFSRSNESVESVVNFDTEADTPAAEAPSEALPEADPAPTTTSEPASADPAPAEATKSAGTESDPIEDAGSVNVFERSGTDSETMGNEATETDEPQGTDEAETDGSRPTDEAETDDSALPEDPPAQDHFPTEVAAAHVLGEDLREELGQLLVDSNSDEVLARILEIAIRATGTQSGSIMLLDPDGAQLRLVVAEGLPAELISKVRQAPGEGVAGEVIKTGKPRLLRGRNRLSPTHRRDVRPKLRESAVVPILSDGRPIGVISVNLESEKARLNEATLSLLGRFAHEVAVAILKAVNLGPLTGERQRDALLRQVERLMALDESMPHRLRAVTEALRKAYRAEIAHLMMLDPLGRRLELMTPRDGLSINRGDFLPLDRGLYGWVVRNRKPQAITLCDESSGLSVGIILLPIGEAPVRGLLVLENIPLPASGPDEPLKHLTEIIEGVAEMIEVEKSLEAQELLSQLQIRVADQSSRFSDLLPMERARAVLEFTVELLAAETAVFIPESGNSAVWARPEGPTAANLQAEIRSCLDPVVEWVQKNGRVAGGTSLPGWDPEAPLCSAPYLGVVTGSNQGVFLLIFSAQDQAGTLNQVPTSIILQVLYQIGELLPTRTRGGDMNRAA